MDWAFVDTGGKVTFAGFTGVGIENCSLEMRTNTVDAQPHESPSPYRRQVSKEYRVQLDGLYDDTAPEHLVRAMLANPSPTVTYLDANGNIIFQGKCVWESSSDTQRSHDFARHSASLVSNGPPTIG